MTRFLLLSDRSGEEVLPAAPVAGLDLKVEPLSAESVARLSELASDWVLVDAVENPEHAERVLRALGDANPKGPVIVVADRGSLDRYPWEELADELLFPGSPAAEIRVRLAMLVRRLGVSDPDWVRLGKLALSAETYQVAVDGRPLDLTYKEFELLRFLASRPGRVFTRAALLREVWGYDFYGGTRTVDVHIRRLRAKLGSEHEHLIETVRGVGYRAADLLEGEL